MIAVFLNQGSQVLGWKIIGSGTMTETLCDPRILFTAALLSAATAIVVIHNHPSGRANPSQFDIDMTKRLHDAGKILRINLLDHIIITPEIQTFYSFAENGLIY